MVEFTVHRLWPFMPMVGITLGRHIFLKDVKDKLVLGENVAQAAQFATTGAADAALLPLSLTFDPELLAGRSVPVPASLYPRIEQAGIVLARARDPALARAFLGFVTGEKGRAILAKYGYGLP